MTYWILECLIISNQISSIMHFNNWRTSPISSHSQLPPTQKVPVASLLYKHGADSVLYGSSTGLSDWYIKKQKLLHKADNYIGRKVCHYMLCTNNIAKITKKWKFELYRFKAYLFTLHTVRVRLKTFCCCMYPGIQFRLPCTPQDNFSWVPNCSLGPPGWETKVSSKKFWFGLCEIAWFYANP